MRIDIDYLKAKLIYLEKMQAKDKTNMSLALDIDSIKNILAYLTGSKYTCDNKELALFTSSFYDEVSSSFLKEKTENIKNLMGKYLDLKLPDKFHFISKISLQEYVELMQAFLRENNISMHEIFNLAMLENRIELNPKPYPNKTGKGIYYKLLTDNKPYILTRFNGKMLTTSTLPHELAHAFQFKDATSPEESLTFSSSFLVETYPKFIEYAFIDFLKENGYYKDALKIERDLLDDIIIIINHQFSNLVDPNNFTSTIGFRNVFDHLLALYLVNEYRQNKKATSLNHFLTMFDEHKEVDIIKQIGLEDIILSGKEAVGSYSRSLQKRK